MLPKAIGALQQASKAINVRSESMVAGRVHAGALSLQQIHFSEAAQREGHLTSAHSLPKGIGVLSEFLS